MTAKPTYADWHTAMTTIRSRLIEDVDRAVTRSDRVKARQALLRGAAYWLWQHDRAEFDRLWAQQIAEWEAGNER